MNDLRINLLFFEGEVYWKFLAMTVNPRISGDENETRVAGKNL